MSQEKIDRYKEEKANRKKNLAKQKRNAILGKIGGVLILILLVAWIGWSGYRNHQEQKEIESQQKELNEYWSNIYQELEESSKNAATSSTGEASSKENESGSSSDSATTSTGESESESKDAAEESTSPQE